MLVPSLIIAAAAVVGPALAAHKCVWVIGKLECAADAEKAANVEVRVIDKDSFRPFDLIDPDDLMGVSFSNQDGHFQLDGCGNDFDWVPGVPNYPEPYIEIRHSCQSGAAGGKQQVLRLPQFAVFVPNTYDMGTIVLDAPPKGNAALPASVSATNVTRVQSNRAK